MSERIDPNVASYGDFQRDSQMIPAQGGGRQRLFLHSLLGIVLGVGGGWFVLWALFDSGNSSQGTGGAGVSSSRKSGSLATNGGFMKGTSSYQSMPLRELYRHCRREVATGRWGSALHWLYKHHKKFELWLHLYWQLAEGLLKTNVASQAAQQYRTLAEQSAYIWSRKMLLYRAARAMLQAGKRKEAQAWLTTSVTLPDVRGKRGWLWWQQERQEAAEALWLYARMVEGEKQLWALQRLWMEYPESDRAPSAEKWWWTHYRKRVFTPNLSTLFGVASRYLGSFRDVEKAGVVLGHLRKRVRSKGDKMRMRRLWVSYEQMRGNAEGEWKQWKEVVELQRRGQQGYTYYQMALVALRVKKNRLWKKTMRWLKKRSRYWYARALLEEGRYAAAWKRESKAKKSWRAAWKASRSKELQMDIYFLRALMLLRSRRKARQAKKEFAQAYKRFKRLSARARRGTPQFLYEYWLARSDERSGKKRSAIRQYGAIFRKAPLSFYGLLAGQRLQALGKLSPLPLLSAKDPQMQWTPPTQNARLYQRLQLLREEGPKELYLLELEAWMLQSGSPSLGARLELVKRSQGTAFSHGLLWLHAIKSQFLEQGKPVSGEFLTTAFPALSQRWPEWASTIRAHRIDSRLAAALLLHLRGFHPSTQRSVRVGPVPEPLWLERRLPPISSDFAEICKQLREYLDQLGQVDLAIEALLTQRTTFAKKLGRTFSKRSADLRYPFLSEETQAILQTYWIYTLLYLPGGA